MHTHNCKPTFAPPYNIDFYYKAYFFTLLASHTIGVLWGTENTHSFITTFSGPSERLLCINAYDRGSASLSINSLSSFISLRLNLWNSLNPSSLRGVPQDRELLKGRDSTPTFSLWHPSMIEHSMCSINAC